MKNQYTIQTPAFGRPWHKLIVNGCLLMESPDYEKLKSIGEKIQGMTYETYQLMLAATALSFIAQGEPLQ